MTTIKPFKALRPKSQFAAEVASKPYDVLNSAEAREETKNTPLSFLHITKSEIDLPSTADSHSPEVYQKAKENLNAFIKNGILFQEEKPEYYIYTLIMKGRKQTGLVAVSSVDDYENDIIKKHEFTRPEKEQDRINHIATSGAQTGNVFLAYRNNKLIDSIIKDWQSTHEAIYDFTADDGVRHTIWAIDEDKIITEITQIFATQIPCTYIADGHHRAASAAKVRKALGANATPEADYFLTTLFPADELYIMDYNRLVKDLNGLTQAAFFEKIQTKFQLSVLGSNEIKPTQSHQFGMYIDHKWYLLTAKEGTFTSDPIGVLDVTILQDNLLAPILNIQDPRTDKRIDFVGGIRGLGELSKRVDSGEMAVAFSLYPVTIHQLFDIAESGNVRPPKSTWFEPKLRDGILTHLIF